MTPIWASWADFCTMGGYGLYVWGAFGVTALALAIESMGVAARRRALDRDNGADDTDSGFQSLPTP